MGFPALRDHGMNLAKSDEGDRKKHHTIHREGGHLEEDVSAVSPEYEQLVEGDIRPTVRSEPRNRLHPARRDEKWPPAPADRGQDQRSEYCQRRGALVRLGDR